MATRARGENAELRDVSEERATRKGDQVVEKHEGERDVYTDAEVSSSKSRGVGFRGRAPRRHISTERRGQGFCFWSVLWECVPTGQSVTLDCD